ncbi:hypothetical protein GGF31_000617 [Allomyces arbusculus]|nr:hypothetical protein GGF31_000617 [Allomyces arbusculus]
MLAALLLPLARLVAVADLVAAVLVADRLDWPLAAVADAVLLSAIRVIALLVLGARRSAHACAASAVYAVGKASILLTQPAHVDDAVVAIAVAAIAVPVAEASLLAMHLHWHDRGGVSGDRDDVESRATASPTTPSPPPVPRGAPPRRTSAVVPDIRAPLLHGTGSVQTYSSFHAPDGPSSSLPPPPPPPPPPGRRPSAPRTNSPALNRWSIATFDRDSLNAYMAAAASGVAPPPSIQAPAPPRFLMHAVRSSLDARSRQRVDEDVDEVAADEVSADEEVGRVAAHRKMGV